MGVVSNKIDITDLQLSGGGGGDPTIPGRVSALEAETVQLAEGLALVQTSVNSGAVPMQTGNKIKFGVDGQGNYGYYKAGADTVTPFLTGGGGGEIVYFDSLRPTTNTTFEITDPKITEKPRAVIIQIVGSTWNTTDGVISAAANYSAGEGSVQRYGFIIRGSGSSLFAKSVNTMDFTAVYSDGTLTIKTSSSYSFPLTTNYHVFIIT